jgi:trimethylamine:corrinoid methyltransferase-like protein
VPEQDALARLEAAGFPVDWESQMVRVTPELLETALSSLPRDITLYDRVGKTAAPFERAPCFMGAGTPVNVLDLETRLRCPATRQDVLPQYEMVRLIVGRFSKVAA